MATRTKQQKPRDPDAARRNTRARFEQWAQNPQCEANAFSAVHNVRMVDVAVAEGLEPSFGQSLFAIAKGDNFEAMLFANQARLMLEALIHRGVLPEGATGFRDLRLRLNRGRHVQSIDQALAGTRELLREAAAARSAAELAALPAIVAGATLRIPRGVMLPEAILILDVLAIRTDGERARLEVGEVKTYPDRGGHTAGGELALARAQAGIYLHGLELSVRELGLEGDVEVAQEGFLVLTRPGSMLASVRPGERLHFQAIRAERGFELLERAAAELAALVGDETGSDAALIERVREAPTAYAETCLSFCDRAAGCYQRALETGDPIVLGEEVSRFLGETSLIRISELLEGARPRDDAERDLLRRIEASRALVRP